MKDGHEDILYKHNAADPEQIVLGVDAKGVLEFYE